MRVATWLRAIGTAAGAATVALLTLGALAAARPVGAQVAAASVALTAAPSAPAAAPAVTVPPGPGAEQAAEAIAAQVRAQVAAQWGLAAEQVRLEWGPGAAALPAEGTVRLVGTGAGGAWVVRVEEGASRAVRVRAGVEVERVVAARALERGALLGAGDLARKSEVRWGPPAAEPAAEPGWETRRSIAAGEVLRPPAAAPPRVVHPGDAVRVVWRRGGVEVSLPARAVGAAALGERVGVRTEHGRRLEGVAAGPGLVRLEEGWLP
jgi:flagellar basal body P-ring formation protein FlgA